MAPEWIYFKLVALLCIMLAQVSEGCDECFSENCVSFFGGKTCTPCVPDPACLAIKQADNVGRQIQEARKRMVAAGAQVEKAESCIESVYSCALGQLKQYLPSLDTQFCDPTYKQRFEEGGWSAYYGPRVWDSQAAGTLVGLFFPATSAAAAAKLVCCAFHVYCWLLRSYVCR